MTAYPEKNLLITPQALQEHLGSENLALLDVRPSFQVMAGVIPGAAHLDVFGLGPRHTRGEVLVEFVHMMRSLLAARGAGSDRKVVVYGDFSDMLAARIHFLLEYFGHQDVQILDGGFGAWQRGGHPVAKTLAPPRPAKLELNLQESLLIGADELRAELENPDVLILDTRSEAEWLGLNTRGGPRGGTIPGAVHLEWLQYLDAEGAFKKPEALGELFAAVKITKDREVIPFCQGGYRSSHAFLALRLLGYPRLRNFLGSWKEWGDRPDLPIVTPQASPREQAPPSSS